MGNVPSNDAFERTNGHRGHGRRYCSAAQRIKPFCLESAARTLASHM